ncbi:hypothetical protein PsalN5692_01633 [Piscirickettsia salmonis]|nr:hypothetical protein PsalN5692_01633 [Piscirickettsia salmonis]
MLVHNLTKNLTIYKIYNMNTHSNTATHDHHPSYYFYS